jgi:hypothetical protein
MRSSLVPIFLLLSITAAGRVESAITNNLTINLSVSYLPQTVVLCRDPTAYLAFGFDEQFEVDIDVDNNAATGLSGTDAILFLATASQGAVCGPTTPLDTASNLTASLVVWDSSTSAFKTAEIIPTFSLDFTTNSISIAVPAEGPLSGLSAASQLAAASEASYHSGTNAYEAFDETPTLAPGQSATLPSEDVQFCSLPCSTSSSYYNFIDLRSVRAVLAPQDPIFTSGFEPTSG